MADFENIIRENLDCPICKDLPVGHIFICERGHSICSRCRRQITSCPLCMGSLTEIRNICAEKIAANISKNCEYSHYGCTTQLMGHDMLSHEETCSFRPFTCDLPGCLMLGTLRCDAEIIPPGNTIQHMLRVHNLAGTISDKVRISYLITEEEIQRKRFNDSKSQARFFKCYGCMFLAVATINESDHSANFCICTSFDMMNRQLEYTNDSFKAQISLENPDGSLLWQGMVHDSKKSLSHVFESGTCLSVKFANIVAFCINDNQTQHTRSFHVVFSVKKTETGSSDEIV